MNVESLLIFLVAAVAGFPLVWHATRRFSVGIMLVFLGMYLKAFVDDGSGVNIGVAVYPLDGVFILVMAAASARMFIRPGVPARNASWLAFGLVLGLSFIIGLASYGTAAGVAFRKFFYFFATTAYVMGFKFDQGKVDLIIRAWLTFAGVLVASVLLRWVVDPAHLGVAILKGNSEDSLRVVPSDMALILGQSFVLALLLRARGELRRKWVYLTPLWLAAVVVLQHRSVWLSVLVGLGTAYLLMGNSIAVKKISRQLMFIAASGLVGFIFLALSGYIDVSGLSSSLGNSYETAVKLDTTAGERLNSWQVLFGMWGEGGARVWLLGFPFGTSMAREVMTPLGELRLLEYGAHNAYVELLFFTGLAGVILFVATFVKVILFLYRRDFNNVHAAFSGRALIVLLVMQLSYYVPYGVEFSQAIWLGVGLSLLACRGDPRTRASRSFAPATSFDTGRRE